MRKIFLTIILTSISLLAISQHIRISDFIVKENLSQNGKLAIIAVDTTEKADDHVNGTFSFTVNGFSHPLRFSDGVSVLDEPIESSTFVFFKHKNQEHEVGKFYFIRKTDKGLTPYKISGLMLLLIPALILLIAYAFKRLIVVFIALAAFFTYLHFSKGLDVGQVLESVFYGLKNLL